MTLTKAQIVGSITEEIPMHKYDATEAVEKLIEIIKSTLESGDDVLISGFGKFCVKDKGKRRGRNPATSRSLTIRAKRIVTFKCSGILRDRVNVRQRKKTSRK